MKEFKNSRGYCVVDRYGRFLYCFTPYKWFNQLDYEPPLKTFYDRGYYFSLEYHRCEIFCLGTVQKKTLIQKVLGIFRWKK